MSARVCHRTQGHIRRREAMHGRLKAESAGEFANNTPHMEVAGEEALTLEVEKQCMVAWKRKALVSLAQQSTHGDRR